MITNFTNAVRASVNQKNWFAALALALALPDICADLECPSSKSQKPYVKWWDAYLLPKYSNSHQTFLSGNDCYALRCSFLHQGGSDLERQWAREVISNFKFVEPPPRGKVHNNLYISSVTGKTVLQLQVDIFCEDICLGVDQWALDKLRDFDIRSRVENMLTIYAVQTRR